MRDEGESARVAIGNRSHGGLRLRVVREYSRAQVLNFFGGIVCFTTSRDDYRRKCQI